ncbi:MAG: hypothetical protein U1F51_12275 [Burkholderiales bacterium]
MNRNATVALLSVVALVAMVAAYFSPIWWVALTAPNYPKDAFPDGIRIHFHMNGVFNGCKAAPGGSRLQKEVLQHDIEEKTERYNPILDKDKDVNKGAEGLDCVHEMNTINHYVGMFPIETGAPVERPLAKFFFAFFATLMVAFAVPSAKGRLAALGVGFAAVAAWMLVDLYALGSHDRFVVNYMNEAGAFFKEPEKIAGWAGTLRMATTTAVGLLIAAMVVLLILVWRRPASALLLALVPALLPLYFLVDYAGWLWFFGHNLHPWGAFTVKPFMPTVFGEGKVAQFSTYSYPYWGYALLVLVFLALVLALLVRRRQWREQAPG